jgi:hypothetical protein
MGKNRYPADVLLAYPSLRLITLKSRSPSAETVVECVM